MEIREVRRVGTLKIVSSGYDDRYVQTDIHMEVEVDLGVVLRVDYEHDRVTAIMLIQGINPANATEEQVEAACALATHSPIHAWAHYEKDEATSGSVSTTPAKLTAGIYAARGYEGLSEYGIESQSKIAATLTDTEWLVVKTGLDRVNREHERTGRPIVQYKIPGATK